MPSDGESYYVGFDISVENALWSVKAAMFPRYFGTERFGYDEAIKRQSELAKAYDEIQKCLRYVLSDEEEIRSKASELIDKLPEIMRSVNTDIIAAYEGDPAAKSTDEVILTYPAFDAITTYRVAHELYKLEVPVLPRKMTEYAHQKTGIDIHPGATIGDYFFIDHGTGVVIGETTIIGERVKLYQHVTLGAKSFAVLDDGTLVKGIKRHPNIGNNVVIYAGATILGDVNIGDNCVIGGSVWLTHSVPEGEMVLTTPPKEIHVPTMEI
ncbi:MAG: serine acetyltransferase [Firmicutes bacterium]|nr:serine acetyltransferase [Bacillota bacterium]MBQ4466690.1 serine acetyltransferase [Bacillota bacterium]